MSQAAPKVFSRRRGASGKARPSAIGGVYPINQYYLPYSGFSPFGFNGRFLYARASVEF